MMTAFEFWASGSSTLATSAAVKADSTFPARANQARFDTPLVFFDLGGLIISQVGGRSSRAVMAHHGASDGVLGAARRRIEVRSGEPGEQRP